MLVSFSEKYVFLSNPKCASTQIENTFADKVELPLLAGRRLGYHPSSGCPLKHTDYQRFCQNYQLFFKQVVPRNRFFVFGIVRDPIDRLHSYYKFGSRSESAIKHLFKDLPFSEYLEIVANGHTGKFKSHFFPRNQYQFFANEDGGVGVNFLCNMSNLENSFDIIERETGLRFHASLSGKSNKSKGGEKYNISEELRQRLKAEMREDFELWEDHTDKLLVRPDNWDSYTIDVNESLEWMKRHNSFDVAASLVYRFQKQPPENNESLIKHLRTAA